MTGKCPFCFMTAEVYSSSVQSDRDITCKSCGKFIVSCDAFMKMGTSNYREYLENNKKIISYVRGFICENPNVRIDLDRLEKILNCKTINIYEKAYKLLNTLNEKIDFPGKTIDRKSILDNSEVISSCYAYDNNEIDYFLKYLKKKDYIHYVDNIIEITPEGYSHLEEYNKSTGRDIAFCAMCFDPSLLPLWDKAIEPAIRASGYDPRKINKEPYNGCVVDEIKALIRRSKFVIADLTRHRNGVYYEAGFAEGLGLPIIFTCEKETHTDAHFDVKHLNTILWEKDKWNELKNELQWRIEGTLGRGRYEVEEAKPVLLL